jgi:ASC-1-like (ASCH) protein
MEHIAIMKKSWGLIPKILSGQKKIESRWYKSKSYPWGRIKKDDVIYFKNSGEPIFIKTEVKRVVSFSDLTPKKVKQILAKYGEDDGIDKNKILEFYRLFKNKRYCLLMFLKNPTKVKLFNINKTGFGMMSAWLTIGDVTDIRI